MITFDNLTIHRGQQSLIENVALTIHAKQKVGLVGKNGCGKSSLLAVMRGELDATAGDISISEQVRVRHVAQEMPEAECSALEFVMQGNAVLHDLQQKITAAEAAEDYESLADLYHQFAECDGYSAESRAASLLHYLGFEGEETQAKAVCDFSGGWRMRLNLAQALYAPSDLLLLDEPTNHLDMKGIIWLEKWLKTYPGTIIIISHDREFLDGVISHVAHISQQTIKLYSGNYSTFEAMLALQLETQQKQFERQQKKIQHMMRFVERFRYKATKAKQAQSRLKMIERIDRVAAVQSTSNIDFEFFEPSANPSPLMTLRKAQLGYGDTVILDKVKMQLLPGERVGILGLNGAGKSTLVKTLAGELPLISGQLTVANGLPLGYFAQHQLELLDGELTAVEHMCRVAAGESMQSMRNYLGGFGFTGDMVLRPCGSLSGGEKSRLVLAALIWQRPALLLLDEPTNHLDIDVRMSLTLALQNYTGAMVLISHDRYLLKTLCDELLLVADGTVTEYQDSVDTYQKTVV